MKTIKHDKFTELAPDNGGWLTQASDEVTERVFSDGVTLGASDSPGNWKEVADEWKAAWEAAHPVDAGLPIDAAGAE